MNIRIVPPKHTDPNELGEFLDNKKNFNKFFVALIFSVLSYTGIHIEANYWLLKIIIVISMLSLLISGVILLIQLQDVQFEIEGQHSDCITKLVNFYHKDIMSTPKYVWIFFGIGMIFIVLAWCLKILFH